MTRESVDKRKQHLNKKGEKIATHDCMMWNTIYAKILVHDEMQIQIAIIISVNMPYMYELDKKRRQEQSRNE